MCFHILNIKSTFEENKKSITHVTCHVKMLKKIKMYSLHLFLRCDLKKKRPKALHVNLYQTTYAQLSVQRQSVCDNAGRPISVGLQESCDRHM